MAVRAAVKLGKSLFDDALEAGYKTADDGLLPLRDSGIMVQAKNGAKPPSNPNFDEELWRELNPRPSEYKKKQSWYAKLSRDRKLAGTGDRDSVGRLPPKTPLKDMGGDIFDPIPPKPAGLPEKTADMTPEQKAIYDEWALERKRVGNRNFARAKRVGIDAPTPTEVERKKRLDAIGAPSRPAHLPHRKADMTPEQLNELAAWRREVDRLVKADKAKDPEYRKAKAARVRERYRRDADEINAGLRERYATDEEYRNKKRQEALRWEQDNPAQAAARKQRRRAAQQQRHAPWSDDKKIQEIYDASIEISRITGEPHHVDHVIPLRGKNDTVSGLHHQDNLLIVPKLDNLQKGNRFEPGDVPPRAGVRNARALLKKIRAEYGITE